MRIITTLATALLLTVGVSSTAHADAASAAAARAYFQVCVAAGGAQKDCAAEARAIRNG